MMIRGFSAAALLLLLSSCQSLDEVRTARIPQGEYVPFFDADQKPVEVRSFHLDMTPVTQSQYLEFVKKNPSWRKSKIKRLFADPDYLKNWKADEQVQSEQAPVTYVSWFAAKAYCEWRGQRLPSIREWEYAALEGKRSGERGDASNDNQAGILNWYSRPGKEPLPEVAKGARNQYGLFDMHGLVWEWVFDFNSVPKNDGRSSSSEFPEDLFCAGGAGAAGDPSDYASFMRFAFRSSLKGSYTIKDLGFRCAKGES